MLSLSSFFYRLRRIFAHESEKQEFGVDEVRPSIFRFGLLFGAPLSCDPSYSTSVLHRSHHGVIQLFVEATAGVKPGVSGLVESGNIDGLAGREGRCATADCLQGLEGGLALDFSISRF